MTMRLWLFGLLTAMIAAVPASAQHGAAQTVYVVRHLNTPAGAPDPDLLPEGQAGAALLPAWFTPEPAQPVAIYVSDYKRTRQTAAPLAARLGLQLTVYDPRDTPALIARVRAEHGPVLVVGHSNTVPDIVAALGGERPADLGHEDFGDIWKIGPGGATQRSRIEARSPSRGNAPTYYILRHFDTPPDVQNPELTPDGRRRAERLARALRRNPPAAIYISDFARTRQTVEPTARRLRLTPRIYDPADTPSLLARVRAERGPVLIVGHSSRIPDIVATLGGERPAAPGQTDFGDLWTIYSNGTSSHGRIELR